MLNNTSSEAFRKRLSAILVLVLLLLLTFSAANAQLVAGGGSGSLISQPGNNNSPNMMVTPQIVQSGTHTTVSYTLLAGYDNKLTLVVENRSGHPVQSSTFVAPLGRFSLPISTVGLSPGIYTVRILSGNLVHFRNFWVMN